jgi:protein-tyrosine phosphatase
LTERSGNKRGQPNSRHSAHTARVSWLAHDPTPNRTEAPRPRRAIRRAITVIDLHCHVLPGLDDGPRGLQDALATARVAVASGTATLVATPHIDHHWNVDPIDVRRRAGILAQELGSEGIDLDIRTGGEIDLSRLADLDPREIDAVRLGDGPYLLLECPHSPSAGDFDALMLSIHARGQPIVLAHPERSPLFQSEPERLIRLVDAGLLCSVTAGSLRGQFGEQVRQLTLEMLREGLVHDVASDCHDPVRRPPGLSEALEDAGREIPGLDGQSEWLTRLAPAAILAGDPLPPRPSMRHVEAFGDLAPELG